MDTPDLILRFALALVLGALIGLERQVGHGDESWSSAGLRTFALYALWGAGAGFMGSEYGAGGFTVAAAAFGGLLVVEYWLAGRRGDTGTTTEAAAFAAFVAAVGSRRLGMRVAAVLIPTATGAGVAWALV